MALPHGLTALRTQPRPAPPSTISTSSSTSSNATVRPQVLTPRATSPTSQVPYVGKLPYPPSSGNRTRQNPHWAARRSILENTAIVNAKTVLAGFKWRLEQYLDISPPYGLIIPEMVEAARQDMEITGPALDMLASAVFADDGDPPVCELPLVQEDSSGKPFCNHTIPITVNTSPHALKPIFEAWSKVVARVRSLEPRFHGEIARIICDLDPLENVINPQVTKLAADIRKIAEDFREQRHYLSFVEETLKIALKELDGRVSFIAPPPPTMNENRGMLENVREESEVGSSSSSRSSSRASRRSLSRARSTNSLRNNNHINGDGMPTATGLRPRASNTSLRIDKEGKPLSDDEAEGGDRGAAAGSNELNRLPRAFVVPPTPRHQEHWSAPGAQYDRSEISNDQSDIYGGILPLTLPLTIPAYPDNPPKKDLLDISNLSIQSHSAPVSPSGSNAPHMATFTRVESPSRRQLPRPPGSSGNSPLNTVGSVSVVGTQSARSIQGPRPLPTRPSRSPQPGGPNGMTSANVPPTAGSMTLSDVGTSFVVPNQSSTSASNMGGGSSDLVDISAFSVPSNLSDTLEVPSSASDYDLQSVRQQYLQSSLTQPFLPSSSSRHRDANRHNARMRLEYGDAVPSSSWMSNTAPSSPQARPSSAESAPPTEWRAPAPSNSRLRDYPSMDRLQGNSSFQQPLHASSSTTQLDRRIPGESSWPAPSSWKEPPVVVPSENNSRPIGGIFRGVKELMKSSRHHNNTDSSKDEDAPPLPPKGPSPRTSAERPVHSTSYQSSPDSALAYYYGTVPPTPPHQTIEAQAAYSPPISAPARAQSFQPTMVGNVAERNADRGDAQQRFATDYPLISPGYAEAYQRNPVLASSYGGAGSSSSRPGHPPNASGRSFNSLYNNSGGYENLSHPTNSYPHTSSSNNNQPLHIVPSVPSSIPMQSPPEKRTTPDIDTIRQTMYGAIAEALATPALREVTIKDAQRAFFSAMSLAILNVSVTLQDPTQDTPNLVTMMGRQIRLTDLPGAYKTCMTELAAVGREARKLGEEDDERAIAYVARGKSLPEPRLGRVRKLLERGMGYVDASGHVRGSSHSNSGGTGRSREFSTKITSLSLEMMKLPDFQGRQELFKILTAR